MNIECKFCNAKYFKSEVFNCCKKGQLCDSLMPYYLHFESIPDLFKCLFNGDHVLSIQFFNSIRALNSSFGFTSFGFSPSFKKNDAILVNSTKGGFTLTIHGTLYHRIGSLLPVDDKAKFCQLFFYDNEFQKTKRTDVFENLNLELTDLIQNILFSCNQLIKSYKQIGKDVLKDNQSVMVIVDDFKKINIQLKDKRLYTKPSANDFAAVLPLKGNDPEYSRDIIIEQTDGKLLRIDDQHPALDPLSYPLFFPNGQVGWSNELTFCVSKNNSLNLQTLENQSLDKGLTYDNSSENDICSESSNSNTSFSNVSQVQNSSDICFLKRITLYMFINFFLQIRDKSFNLLFKGKLIYRYFIQLF